jgi:hypothetical protein
MKHVSRISGTCVSFLLNMLKKEYLQIILHGMPLAPTHSMPVGTHTRTYVCQWASYRPGAISTTWSTSCLTSLKGGTHANYVHLSYGKRETRVHITCLPFGLQKRPSTGNSTLDTSKATRCSCQFGHVQRAAWEMPSVE